MSKSIWTGKPSWKLNAFNLLMILVSIIGFLWTFAILSEQKPSQYNQLIFILCLTCVIAFFLFNMLFIVFEITRRFMIYALTQNVVSSKTGILFRSGQELPVKGIREIRVYQTLLHRILGIGRITMATAAHAGVEMTWIGVENPWQVKKMITEIQFKDER